MSAHSTMRAALWLGSALDVCIVCSRHTGPSLVADSLAESPYRVTVVAVGRSVAEELRAGQPSLVVIDTSTGAFDAVRLCRDVRDSCDAPIVVAADDERTVDDGFVISLLDAGASEVVGAGISPDRLLAHLRAALRSSPPRPVPPRLTVGDVIIDLEAHVLSIGGQIVPCPPLLFSLLVALASAPNKVTTRETLLARVWGMEPGTVDARRVRVAASLLRRVLGVGPRRPRLETVSRVGYRLAVD